MYAIKQICKSYGNKFLMLQISRNGEIFKGISTYPKINTFSHYICSRHQNVVTYYRCSQILQCKHAEDILFTVSTFGFLFTALVHHLNINTSIHLVRNGKTRCFIIFKIKVYMFPPLTQQILYTIDLYCPFTQYM